MIPVNIWTSVKLLREKGHSIKKIARLLSISRNTVRKALRQDSYLEFHDSGKSNTRPSRSQVAPFHDRIVEMLIKQQFIGSRIFNELKAQGYHGSRTALYEYLRQLKGALALSTICERYETMPGEMMQFDWSDYTVMIGGALQKVHVFDTILAYSRYRKYSASLDVKQGSVIEAIEDAYRFFEGVGKTILVDNAKSMVLKHARGDLERNPKFLEVMGYYGVEPKACWPRRPQTKGKVENPFYYLQEHFIKGHEFTSFADFLAKLAVFNDAVNARRHQGIDEIPMDRFLRDEKQMLKPLPEHPFIGVSEEFRKVSHDCLISVLANKYSVPYVHAGKSVWVRISQGCRLHVFSQQGKLIADHALDTGRKHQVVIEQRHYEGLRRRRISDKDLLFSMFRERFPDQAQYVEKLTAVQRFNARHHLFRILDAVNYYPVEAVNRALSRAHQLNSYSAEVVLGLLRAHDTVQMKDIVVLSAKKSVPAVDIRRDLNDYTEVISHD